MAAEKSIRVSGVSHFFGTGALRKQILFDVSFEIAAGEIVIVTGPSGSGKTTLLTLVGALRSAQEGSLEVLGSELRSASARALADVRRRIGYIFQAHNLLGALSAAQNVELGALLTPDAPRAQARARATEMLAAVGLAERAGHVPSQLSGGQRQRVAIARALAGRPRLILADEPTASLDKESGRAVVDLLHDLAKQHGVTVILVTHDNRILDVADRIVSLEDGRLQSFSDAVASSTRLLTSMLAQANRKGELARRLAELPEGEVMGLLEQATHEARRFLDAMSMSDDEAFESMLDQMLEAFTLRFGALVAAERASLFLADRDRQELWLRVAQPEGGRAVEFRMPLATGIAGHVVATGSPVRVADAYDDPRFNPAADLQTGFRTRDVLCVPLVNRSGHVFGAAQLLNKLGGRTFDESDERRLVAFTSSIAVVLESWTEMRRLRSAPAHAAV